MKVKDIMTQSVDHLDPAASIFDAAVLMQKNDIGSIPVCDSNGVVGILTDRDIVVRSVAIGSNPKQTPVRDIMTKGVTTVTSDMDINEVSKLMASSKIRRIPVVDFNKLVGIVALGDIATDAKKKTEVADTLSDISQPSKPQKMQ